jgi:HAD superfamily 5'-nucleotidase-like hydrolase
MDDRALCFAPIPQERRIFCNRTLNLRGIRAIGYDMDYTLIHYLAEAWERRAYEHAREQLARLGWPVEQLAFDPDFVIRGLVLDTERGNLVKANGFGYIKRAYHGTTPLEYDEQRQVYGRTIVDVAESRWAFLNTFFSLSEGCIYAQLVDLLDQRRLPEVLGYADLYRRVRHAIDRAHHMEGTLKAEITAAPERFIAADPETPLALLDQRQAGKKLILITNSDWAYTRTVLTWAFDRFLPRGMTFRDVFDVLLVSARKPDFFTQKLPVFEVVSEDGSLRPAFELRQGGAFLGGDAALVESYLGLSGDEILFVGDHIYSDVHVSKSVLRWRTGLILREIESEIAIAEAMLAAEERLGALMRHKEQLEHAGCCLRLEALRLRGAYGPQGVLQDEDITGRLADLRQRIAALDAEIGPLAKAASEVMNPRWGLLMHAGNDKSYLAVQVERSADIYTSRVSNFLLLTPFAYLRPPRGSLPHDPVAAPPGSLPIESA